jgi:isoleucyl-tRNA synthetase
MGYPRATSGPGDVPASPDFPALEERVLEFWDRDGTFRASVANRSAGSRDDGDGGNEFVFYDGPVRHEAPCHRVEVRDLHRQVVAATWRS